MTSANALLTRLRGLGIEIWAEDGQLCLKGDKGAITSELAGELRDCKQELLVFLRDVDQETGPPLIEPAPRDQEIPLSFAQQRLWFLEQLEVPPVYIIPQALRLSGPIDIALLERCFAEIVRRHEILRTGFAVSNGKPYQKIEENVHFALRIVDLPGTDTDRTETAIRALVDENARTPFDLTQPPLFRVTLARIGPEDNVLLPAMHHIVSDGWSMGVLIRELAHLYKTGAAGEPSALNPLPVQYADFAVWQRRFLGEEAMAQQTAYWKEQLEDPPALTALPTDRTRPRVPSSAGALERFRLEVGLAKKVVQRCKELDITPFMMLESVFGLLLARYSRQNDIAIGVPVANRTRRELEPLIGFFVNTLVLRHRFRPGTRVSQFLGETKATTLAAYDHQDIPFERVVEEVNPERNLGYSPLFQVMFALQNLSVGRLELSGLTMTPLEAEHQTAIFDMSLVLEEGVRGFEGHWEYNTALFDRETITIMIDHYRALLRAVLDGPDRSLAELDMEGDESRRAALRIWNGPRAEDPTRPLFHGLFEEQPASRPDAAALVFVPFLQALDRGTIISYHALNTEVNRLARYLTGKGVHPDMLVGIYMERHPRLIVAMLAILKAGGAFVNLDPRGPATRNDFIVEDAGLALVLTNGPAPVLESKPEIIDLERDAGALAAMSDTNPEVRVSPENLAYAIYTSGSTGKPKGVLIEHCAIAEHCFHIMRFFSFSHEDRALQFGSFTFDGSLEEWAPPLLSGGCLVLKGEEPWSASEYTGVLDRFRIDTAGPLSTAYWQSLVLDWSARVDGLPARLPLKLMDVGGEAMPLETVKLWNRLGLNRVRLVNGYGPTEATISSSFYEIPNPVPERRLSIGRSLVNRASYILDDAGRPVPVNVPGELCLGGSGLARGYLNRPDTTAETFVPDPLFGKPGARCYKTGDLARYRPDGHLEYLGRTDHQVKLRGFRVELGEIEHAIGRHENVVRAAVLIYRDSGPERLVAFLQTEREDADFETELRGFLKTDLPAYMVPAQFVFCDNLALTPSGKVDRRALPEPGPLSHGDAAGTHVAARTQTERDIAAIWRDLLQLEKVGIHDNFFDLGGHSLLLIQLHSRLTGELNADLSLLDLFQHPTIHALAERLHVGRESGDVIEKGKERARLRRGAADRTGDIAIIGFSGRFPGASDMETFWENLANGVESITFLDDETLREAGEDPDQIRDPHYVKAGAFLDDIEYFDAAFFGYTPREAEVMDPQQRIFLEGAWHALEHAGYNPETHGESIGVYAGLGLNRYLFTNLLANPEALFSLGVFQSTVINDKDHLPTHVAYKLNLRGPSINVQTACSTSLVAVHLACQSLIGAECEIALAGGVSLGSLKKTGYMHHPDSIHSPDGHCRAFDARAQGTVAGGGMGIMVLKRLDRALADRDTIHGVIKGSAVNNDGSLKVGYTAPGVEGQASVIAEAMAVAGADPETISYVEAHGTGTVLGDPIEVEALNRAFRASTAKKQYCALGSVKSNFGHLDTAAGVTGLLKTVLALEHGLIPASLHFEEPNPKIDFDGPFFVNNRARPWPRTDKPRRAGVSSFGIGGANAHVVLEEPPTREPESPARPFELLVLSARTGTALEKTSLQLADYLDRHPEIPLGDAAYTLQIGRKAFTSRRALVCRDRTEAVSVLRAPFTALGPEDIAVSPVFMFPGQGAQHPGMAMGLYRDVSAFRGHFDQCVELYQTVAGEDLRELLFSEGDGSLEERLTRTVAAQPAIFVVEYALAQTWLGWGVRPGAMIGHSLGEYVAACIAGVLSLEDALALVAARAELMDRLPSGAMLAVPLPEPEITELLEAELSLAAVNASSRCVVSGPAEAIDRLRDSLKERGVDSRILHTSHAFHSAMMDPVLEPFGAKVRATRLSPPRIPYISNLTGTWIEPGQATDPEYWVDHLRRTVRFERGLRTVLTETDGPFLEVGPGRTLTSLAAAHPERGHRIAVAGMPHPRDNREEAAHLTGALGKLWCLGVAPDWSAFTGDDPRSRVPLPGYPFERERFWIEPERGNAPFGRAKTAARKTEIEDWFYVPTWQESPLPEPETRKSDARYLIFADGLGFADLLTDRIGRCVLVEPGAGFDMLGPNRYILNPDNPDDYTSLMRDLVSNDKAPDRIIHLWNVTGDIRQEPDSHHGRALAFFSLIHLAQAIGNLRITRDIRIAAVADRLWEVAGEIEIQPEKAALLGPCLTIPQEYENLSCRVIDLCVTGGARDGSLADRILVELESDNDDQQIAYRGYHRLTRSYKPVRLKAPALGPPRLRRGGTYLITGGLGGIGYALAEHLASEYRANLVLVGRSEIPDRDRRPSMLSERGHDDRTRLAVEKLQNLEAMGAKTLSVSADVSDADDLRSGIEKARARFGRIDGVIHAAGVPGGGAVQLKDRDEANAVLAPKIEGALNLHRLLGDDPPEFMVLCSSLTSVLGGFGQVDYCAANAFLDAFAHYRTEVEGLFTVSINWSAWREVGMAEQAARLQNRTLDDGISPGNGVDAFCRALSCPSPQLLVSDRDFDVIRRHAREAVKLLKRNPDPNRTGSAHPRPNLAAEYAEPVSETEKKLAEIWRECLGFDKIGIRDNFFELGGDSLLATRILSRIEETFGTRLTLTGLFEEPTLLGVAMLIDTAGADDEPDEPRETPAQPERERMRI